MRWNLLQPMPGVESEPGDEALGRHFRSETKMIGHRLEGLRIIQAKSGRCLGY
jgi:hypothetical protein